MPLVRDGVVVADPWQRIEDGAPVPASGPVILSGARWRADRTELTDRDGPIGIALSNTEAAEDLASDLGRVALIALAFPKFSDGRAYSQARVLRERLGFVGELRATGQVLPDQLVHMLRCGFDSFEAPDLRLVDNWAKIVATLPAFYQPVGNVRPTLDQLRGRPASVAAA